MSKVSRFAKHAVRLSRFRDAVSVPQARSLAGSARPDKVLEMVSAYRSFGHKIAQLDPLGLGEADLDGSMPPELEVRSQRVKSG